MLYNIIVHLQIWLDAVHFSLTYMSITLNLLKCFSHIINAILLQGTIIVNDYVHRIELLLLHQHLLFLNDKVFFYVKVIIITMFLLSHYYPNQKYGLNDIIFFLPINFYIYGMLKILDQFYLYIMLKNYVYM